MLVLLVPGVTVDDDAEGAAVGLIEGESAVGQYADGDFDVLCCPVSRLELGEGLGWRRDLPRIWAWKVPCLKAKFWLLVVGEAGTGGGADILCMSDWISSEARRYAGRAS